MEKKERTITTCLGVFNIICEEGTWYSVSISDDADYYTLGEKNLTDDEIKALHKEIMLETSDECEFGESEYLESGLDTRTGEIFDNYYSK